MDIADIYNDDFFMKAALQEAYKALEEGEIPVGAVVVCNNKIIAKGYNQTELMCDVTAHAEMIAITAASNFLGNKYLHDCEIFITLEPCAMCAGALKWSQISRVVFGASDPKHGFNQDGNNLLHPKTKVSRGVQAPLCEQLIKDFFARLRE